jgi:integrase
MPIKSAPLTVKQIAELSAIGRHRVSEGLYLRVTAHGRYWDARITVDGKRSWKAIGDAATMSVVIARKLAGAQAEKVPTNRSRTVGVVWAEYIERHCDSWKSAIHLRQWNQSGDDYVLPIIGERRIDELRPEHIANVLTDLWKTKHETARRIRGRLQLVIDYEFARLGLMLANPADLRFIKPLMPRVRQSEDHHAAPTMNELRKLYQALGEDVSHRCLRWVILTACRTTEARLARSSEVKDGVWTVPASRMKAGREFKTLAPWVPDEKGLLFAINGEALSLNGMRGILVKRNLPFTVHGIRSTFSDWATQKGYDSRLIEAQLAHSDKDKVRAAYQRSDLLEQRVVLMQHWKKDLEKKV